MKGYELYFDDSTHRILLVIHKSERSLNAMLKKRDRDKTPALAFCEKHTPDGDGIVAHIHINESGGDIINCVAHEALHAARHIVELRGTDKTEEEEELASWTGRITATAMLAFASHRKNKKRKN